MCIRDRDQYEAVTGILGKYNVPIIMDLDIGHIPPAMPLICGSYAKAVSYTHLDVYKRQYPLR